MRSLGEFILRGRWQAILLGSLLAMIGLHMPLFSYLLCGLCPALVTLRKGPVIGLQVITGSVVLTALLALPVDLRPQAVIATAAAIWLPVWFCAAVLRASESQGRLLLAAASCVLLYIVLMHVLIDDVTKWWDTWLDLWLKQVLQQDALAQYQELLKTVAPLMNAMTAAGLFISLVTTLLVARWWQAVLFNPGGFRREFHHLRLPRQLIVAVFAGLLLVALGRLAPGSVVMDMLFLLVFLYLLQGIASIHRTVARQGLASAWLAGLYALLLVVPQTILFVACLGMVDSWLIKPDDGGRNDIS